MSNSSRLRIAAATLGACALLTAGCSSSSSHSGSTNTKASGTTVSLKSLMFGPTVLRVKAGTTVTWRNDEPITHTVTSGKYLGVDKTTGLRSGQHADGRFNHKLTGNGDTFSYTFKTPGTYPYYCDIHQGMNAEVVVST